MTSRFAEARDARRSACASHAEAAGFDSLASHARVEALAALGGGRRRPRLPPSTCSTRAPARTPATRFPATGAGWPCSGPGWRSRPATSTRPPRYTEEAKPVDRPQPRSGSLGLDAHLAARQGDLARARARARRAAGPSIAEEGYAPPSQVHDIMAAALASRPRSGRAATARRARPASSRATGCTADHPWRQLLDAQLAEAEGRIEEAAAPVRGGRGLGGSTPPACSPATAAPPTSGPPAASSPSGRLDEARAHADGRRRAPGPLARLAGRRARRRAAAARRRTRARAARRRSRRASGRSPASWPRASPTPGWPSGCSSRRGPPPSTSRTSSPSSGMSSRTEVAAWAVREGLAARRARPPRLTCTRLATQGDRDAVHRGARRPRRRRPHHGGADLAPRPRRSGRAGAAPPQRRAGAGARRGRGHRPDEGAPRRP